MACIAGGGRPRCSSCSSPLPVPPASTGVCDDLYGGYVQASAAGLRTAFGAVLFIAWGVATILWVYTAIHGLGEGEPVRPSGGSARCC